MLGRRRSVTHAACDERAEMHTRAHASAHAHRLDTTLSEVGALLSNLTVNDDGCALSVPSCCAWQCCFCLAGKRRAPANPLRAEADA